MTRVYHGMFRMRGKGSDGKLSSMGRIRNFKFPRNITAPTMRAQFNDPLTVIKHNPRSLVQIIVRRVILLVEGDCEIPEPHRRLCQA
jgi:hypothetical protein